MEDPRTSIQLPKVVLEQVDKRWRDMGYLSRTAYFLALTEIDLRDRPEHRIVVVRSENPESVADGDRVVKGAAESTRASVRPKKTG